MTDYTVADTIYLMFTTRAFATGIPTVLAGVPVVSAYENDSITQITAGITLGVSHDGVVGMNLLTIVATGANGFESGKDYNLVITTGTVGSVSVVGEVVGTFSLGRSAAAVDLANGTDGLGVIAGRLPSALVSGRMDSDVGALGGVAQSLLDLKDFADAGYDPVTNKVQGVVLVDTTTTNTDMVSAPPTLADIADAIWDEAVAGHVAGGSFGEEVQAHALTSEITALENVSVAQVNAEVVTALAAIRLDELLAADSDIDGAAPPTVGSVFHELLTKSLAGFTYDQATDSLEALRDRGDAAWVTGATAPTAAVVADAVWDEARAAHVAAGSFGEGVVIETNNDKTGYAIGVGGIAATSFAAGAINAAATSTDFINEIWAKICEDQGNYTAQQILSVLLSACAGVTAAATFKTPNGVSDRITATLNASEERTAITLNPSAGA